MKKAGAPASAFFVVAGYSAACRVVSRNGWAG
ncbi:hypothetical protein LNAOJCKE_1500 [Methylorubrum aminovorans]|uniref:Lipoprotein n=1 Tax=Methylorubrum aminovorans TaxID=269069 RepID=A0ABQ4UCU1_9HYPH|nr:hypothetical protein LNAOJCKE_1500 [Methylorubrum aminovorans]